MKIGCIGWGSLIWDPRDLLIKDDWELDGPLLPLEFLRQSNDGRLTLVIDRRLGAKSVGTLWTRMDTENLDQAILSLSKREGTTSRPIGVLKKYDNPPQQHIENIIYQWLRTKDLDAVIWTNLGPKFNGANEAPDLRLAIEYLTNLPATEKTIAEEYIRKAPICVETNYRSAFEREFGWKFDKQFHPVANNDY